MWYDIWVLSKNGEIHAIENFYVTDKNWDNPGPGHCSRASWHSEKSNTGIFLQKANCPSHIQVSYSSDTELLSPPRLGDGKIQQTLTNYRAGFEVGGIDLVPNMKLTIIIYLTVTERNNYMSFLESCQSHSLAVTLLKNSF